MCYSSLKSAKSLDHRKIFQGSLDSISQSPCLHNSHRSLNRRICSFSDFSFHKVLGTWKIWLQKFLSFYNTFGLKKSWLLNPSKNFIKFLLLSTWSIEIVITDSKQNFFNSLQNAYGKKISFCRTFPKTFSTLHREYGNKSS